MFRTNENVPVGEIKQIKGVIESLNDNVYIVKKWPSNHEKIFLELLKG